jgi:chromosome segregation ATPase
VSEIETLQAASLLANAEAEKQQDLLRKLERELEETGTQLSFSDYGTLTAQIAQQERRADAAGHKAAEKQAAIDELRERESAKLARDVASRALADVEARLRATQAEITSKREALSQLQNELPLIAQRSSMLMSELSAKRDDLQRLGA